MDIEINDNSAVIDADTSGITAAFFRVYEAGEMVYYASSRLGTVDITPAGFIIYIPAEQADKNYELKTFPGLRVTAKGKLFINIKEVENDG
ncbi:MAG: hypothetical protein R6W90_07565 [Ignavibacteriaceae bacterium]